MDPVDTFVICSPDGRTRRVPFTGGPLFIGRSAENGIPLDHAMISRSHAELWRDVDGSFRVRDLQSRNHTFVNGEQATDRVLGHGDVISVGPFTVTLEKGRASPSNSTRVLLDDGAGAQISRLQYFAPPRIDVSQLTQLNALGNKLLQIAGADERMEELCRLMVGPQFRGRWAVVVRISAQDNDQVPQLLHETRASAATGEPYLSRSVLQLLRESGDPVLASNTRMSGDQQVNVEVSIAPQVIAMAAVACPIRRSKEEVELLYVMLPPALGSGEWLALVNLAAQQYQQAEAAWAARKVAEAAAVVHQELAHARRIQMRLVPVQPKVPGLDLAISFTPCHGVGGDYVDVVAMPDGRTLLTVADVCGKGLGAALVSSSLHTMVHGAVLSGLGLRPLMSILNHYLCSMLPEDSFVTMIAIVIDPATGAGEMINAGHPPVILISPNNASRLLDGEGNFPLRCADGEFALQSFSMETGDVIALYTDGLSELHTQANSMLGIDGLARELRVIFDAGPATLVNAATALANRLATLGGDNPASDDLTFLLVRRL